MENELMKLATYQNKADVERMYKCHWEKLYKGAENVKVELTSNWQDDSISLSVVNDAVVSPFGSKLVNKVTDISTVFVKPDILRITDSPVSSQKPNEICCDKTISKTVGQVISIGGIGREQHTNFMYKYLSNADVVHRKMIVESDMEKNKHKIDNNESISKSEEGEWLGVRSRSTRKKHRRKLNKLIEQLSTCNLEENAKHDFLDNKKLSQKIKKTKGKKIDSSILLNCAKNQTTQSNNSDQPSLLSMLNMYTNITLPNVWYPKYSNPMKQLQIFFDTKTKGTVEELISGNKEDSVEHKIELNSLLKSSTEKNEVTDKLKKNKELVGMEHIARKIMNSRMEKQQKCDDSDCKFTSLMRRSQQSISKGTKNQLTQDTLDEETILSKEFLHKILKDRIQKKKDQRYCSKHIKKTVEKLKGETLAHELNSVIKNLMAFDLTEEINANTIKKKPTQTHFTPV